MPASARALQDAAEAVLAAPAAWRWQALNPGEARGVLDRVVSFVAGGRTEGADSVEMPGVASLRLRLIALLRRQLLRDPRGLSDAAVLQVLARLDDLHAAIEAAAERDLTFLFTGANALELVVEFAHDLRSPLTSIMFLAETLRKGQSGPINDIQRGQLGIVYSAALGMVGLANDLMDLASAELDEEWGHFSGETFSIEELVAGVRKMVAPMIEQKRLDMAFITPDQDLRIGKPVLLNRVLLNLLTNAIKFTDQGRIDIVVEDGPGALVSFSVSDTGQGMSPADLDALYALFDRSQSQTGFHFSGTGLGLSICKRMVEIMGGELKVESGLDDGTRFFFELELPPA